MFKQIKIFLIVYITMLSLSFSEENNKIKFVSKGIKDTKLNYTSSSDLELIKNEILNQFNEYPNNIENINIPSYTTFYKVNNGYNLNATYNVVESSTFNDIATPAYLNYSNINTYPENNLIISEPLIFRGLIVYQITFIPFSINKC